MTITALPPAPIPTDNRSTFNAKAFALAGALDQFVSETNAVAAAASANATSAATAANTATTQAGNAATSASTASTAASTATTQAGNAATSASNASTSAATATTQAGNAAASASSASANADAVAAALAVISAGPVISINGLGGIVVLTPSSIGAEPADATILKNAAIGASVQAYSANLTTWSTKSAPLGITVGTTDTQTLTSKTMTTGCVWNGSTIAVQYGGTGVVTLTGLVKGNGTSAFTAAVAGTDFVSPGGALGTPSSGALDNCTVGGKKIGYRNVPLVVRNANYTFTAADAGGGAIHTSADTAARTYTIPANASVPYDVGDAITIVNQNGAGVITIAIISDTMRLAGAGTTGSRTLAANGIATAIKLTSTEWIISGAGLT